MSTRLSISPRARHCSGARFDLRLRLPLAGAIERDVAESLGNAKVEKLGQKLPRTRDDHDVGGLDVAVDKTRFVRRVNDFAQPLKERNETTERYRTASDLRGLPGTAGKDAGNYHLWLVRFESKKVVELLRIHPRGYEFAQLGIKAKRPE